VLARYLFRLLVIIIPLAVSASAVAQSSDDQPLRFHGIFEEYFETDPTHRGIVGELMHVQLQADISRSWKLVASYAQEPGDNWLDETYAELDSGPNVFRFGRFRSDFGFSNWSEVYYTPMIIFPMIRSYSLNVVPGISLYRLDRGTEFETSKGNFQLQVSAVDSSDNDWSVFPGSVDTGIVRLQISCGPVIVGLNGFAKANDNLGPGEQIGGVDFSWTAPRLQLRGEAISGSGSQSAKGYYVDLFYRPPGLARTQVGARVQGAQAPVESYDSSVTSTFGPVGSAPSADEKALVYTLAARQFLTKNLTLSVNYGAGNNTALSRSSLGWSSQLQFSYRF
jgi:hypothetical protein